MNKKSFDIFLNNKKSFNIIPFGIKKSFGIMLNNKTSFLLYIDGINLIDRYKSFFKSRLNLVFSTKMKAKAIGSISSKLNLILILRDKVFNILQISQKMNLIFNTKQTLNIDNTWTSKLDIIFILRDIAKIPLDVVGSKLNILFFPKLKTMNTIGYWDGFVLGDMDDLTLSQIDGFSYDFVYDDNNNFVVDDNGNYFVEEVI